MADFDLGALLKGFTEGYSASAKLKIEQEELNLKKKAAELENIKALTKMAEDYQMKAKEATPDQQWTPQSINDLGTLSKQLQPTKPWDKPIKSLKYDPSVSSTNTGTTAGLPQSAPSSPSAPPEQFAPAPLGQIKPLRQLGSPNIQPPRKEQFIPGQPAQEARPLTVDEAKGGPTSAMEFKPKATGIFYEESIDKKGNTTLKPYLTPDGNTIQTGDDKNKVIKQITKKEEKTLKQLEDEANARAKGRKVGEAAANASADEEFLKNLSSSPSIKKLPPIDKEALDWAIKILKDTKATSDDKDKAKIILKKLGIKK